MEPKTRYYMFIIGRFISTFGNWFASMAVPFIIYDLTGSAMAVSVSFLLETLPVILLSPLISRQIDNCSRKILLQLCEAMSGLSILCCVLTSCDNIYVLYFMCMVLSVASFTYNTTVNAYVPDICGDLELKTANTIDSFASNVSMVIAPVLAGMCIEWKGYQVALIIDIGTFILSIVFLNFLQKDIRLRKAEAKTHYLKDTFLSPGFLEWMNKEAFLKSLIIICILFSICGAIFSSLDAVYIAEIFDGSSDVYGYINSAWGIGMLVTSALYFLYKNFPETKMFSIGILIMGIATIGYGLSTNIPICVVFNFIGGVSNTIYMIYYKSLIQSSTTPENRGKVFTFQSTLSKILSMVVVFLAGVFADISSVRFSIVLSGIFTILIALWCFKILSKKFSVAVK